MRALCLEAGRWINYAELALGQATVGLWVVVLRLSEDLQLPLLQEVLLVAILDAQS